VNDRPSAPELLGAVGRFLERDALPRLDGPARFHARVAAHVVAMVARELEAEESHLSAEWQRLGELLERPEPPPASRQALRDAVRERSQALCERIRAGAADGGPWRERVLDHLRRTVDDKLAVARGPRRGD
jgi:hypothetical protein